MEYRKFVDHSGCTWRVWEVKPATVFDPKGDVALSTVANHEGVRHLAGMTTPSGGGAAFSPSAILP